MKNKLKIGLSFSDFRIEEYREYLKKTKYSVEVIDLSYHEMNTSDLKKCDALVLSGGIDIHPGIYGKEDKISLCGKNIVEKRDEFELNLIDSALNINMPIFGICRGMQIVNVSPYFGGTMYCDIDTEVKNREMNIFHRVEAKEGARHVIRLMENTMLKEILKSGETEVNSFHHQAVENPGKGLKVSSYALDGIIESLEWELQDSKPFLLLVQWHPERMEDESSRIILESFYEHI
jgi:putative glutamine amidotransferase